MFITAFKGCGRLPESNLCHWLRVIQNIGMPLLIGTATTCAGVLSSLNHPTSLNKFCQWWFVQTQKKLEESKLIKCWTCEDFSYIHISFLVSTNKTPCSTASPNFAEELDEDEMFVDEFMKASEVHPVVSRGERWLPGLHWKSRMKWLQQSSDIWIFQIEKAIRFTYMVHTCFIMRQDELTWTCLSCLILILRNDSDFQMFLL